MAAVTWIIALSTSKATRPDKYALQMNSGLLPAWMDPCPIPCPTPKGNRLTGDQGIQPYMADYISICLHSIQCYKRQTCQTMCEISHRHSEDKLPCNLWVLESLALGCFLHTVKSQYAFLVCYSIQTHKGKIKSNSEKKNKTL